MTAASQRTFPRAIVIGTASLIGIYLFANVGYLAALGVDGVANSDRVAAEAVAAIVGPGSAKLIAAAILVSGIVSVTLTPMLCSRFLQPPHAVRHGRLYMATEKVFRTAYWKRWPLDSPASRPAMAAFPKPSPIWNRASWCRNQISPAWSTGWLAGESV